MNKLFFYALLLSAIVVNFTGKADAQTIEPVPTPTPLVKKTSSVSPVGATRKKNSVRPIERADLLVMLYVAADDQGIPRKLLASLVEVESRWRICTDSPKDARGLTQFIPATAARFGLTVNQFVDDRCNPDKALRAGAQYLRWLVDYFNGDVILALAGYNAGEGAVDKFGGRIPPYKETIQYVEKILQLYTGKVGLSMSRSYNAALSSRYLAELGVNTRSAMTAMVSNTTLPVRNPQISELRNEAEATTLPLDKPRVEETRLPMRSFFYPPDQEKEK